MKVSRRGFSLLEVIVALAILVTSLVILMETQTDAMKMTIEAEQIVTATNLANEKVSEVALIQEQTGFTDSDVCDEGDFGTSSDETAQLEFGDSLKEYHYEWCVEEVDIQLAGDLSSMASSLGGSGYNGSTGASSEAASAAGVDAATAAGGSQLPDLSALGISPDMISDLLGNYIRQVRVRVWWGPDSKSAAENGDEIVIVTHVINPTGAVTATGGNPNQDPSASDSTGSTSTPQGGRTLPGKGGGGGMPTIGGGVPSAGGRPGPGPGGGGR